MTQTKTFKERLNELAKPKYLIPAFIICFVLLVGSRSFRRYLGVSHLFNMPAAQVDMMIEPGIGRVGSVATEEITEVGGFEGTLQKILPGRGYMPPPPGGDDLVLEETDRKIVKSASVDMEVEDVESAAEEIADYVVGRGGMVVSSNINYRAKRKQTYMTLRVPVSSFENVLKHLRRFAVEILNESVSGQDETGRYVDLEGRLRALQASEAQFLKIMEGADTTQDILQVQRELENVRSRIESVQAQMKNIASRSDMSTINLTMVEPEDLLPGLDTSLGDYAEIVRNAVRSLMKFINFIVKVVIWLVVFSPIWLPVYLLVRKKKKI